MSKRRIKLLNLPSLLFLIGLFLIFLIFLPNIILEQQAFVRVHDQLDGEVINYIFHAQNFSAPYFPAFMSGQALYLPSPALVIFYILFPPFTAFIASYLFVLVIAYIGMFLLLKEFTNSNWISSGVAVSFCLLPFFPLHGLSVMGAPILSYAIICLIKNKNIFTSYIIIAVYAAFSSLVLIGWFYVLLLLLLLMITLIRKHPCRKKILIAFSLLVFVFILGNTQLITSMLISAELTHRYNWMPEAIPFWDRFQDIYINGSMHATSNHRLIRFFSTSTLLFSILVYQTKQIYEKQILFLKKTIAGSLALIFLTIGFDSLWTTSLIIRLRAVLGGSFLSFQANRINFINPTLWFFVFGLCLSLLSSQTKQESNNISKVVTYLRKYIALVCFVSISFNLYNQSVLAINVGRLQTPHHSHDSWQGFFMVDVFEEIAQQIDKPFDTYRVASIGIHPAVALYNGFYTIDGYSSNYQLDHKLAFREIISYELEKNNALRLYFDDWGSRAYIFVDQLGDQQGNPDPRRNNDIILTEINLNIDQMRMMDVHYIFSASVIDSPYMTDINLLGEFQSYQRETRVWVYEIQQQ